MSLNDPQKFPWDFDLKEPAPADLFLLKWEATHLHDFIWDIPDLSCIRGASELLDDFVRPGGVAEKRLVGAAGVTGPLRVYGSGDQVLFLVRGQRKDVEAAGRLLVTEFAAHAMGPCGFGVASLGGSGSLPLALDTCDRAIQQMRVSGLGLDPGRDAGGKPIGRDGFDGLRLAARKITRGPRSIPASERTSLRFQRGRTGRWGLVQALAHAAGLDLAAVQPPACQDFAGLASLCSRPGYLAYLAFDGNGFTALRRRCRTLSQLNAFALFVEAALARVLGRLLGPELERLVHQEPIQPVQFLYLAGDEGELALAGDRGVDVALGLARDLPGVSQDLLQSLPSGHPLSAPDFQDPGGVNALASLSTSVGLVIAHAETPVRLLRKSAQELLASVKVGRRAAAAAQSGTPPDLDFMVFESHVTTPDDIASYRSRHLVGPASPTTGDPLQLHSRPWAAAGFQQLVETIRDVRSADLATGPRHRVAWMVASAATAPDGAAAEAILKEASAVLRTMTGGAPGVASLQSVAQLVDPDAGNRVPYLDFQELFDWVV